MDAKNRQKKYGPDDALKALSSLVENNPGDLVLAADTGFSAMEMGLGGHAYHLFGRVAESRPFLPHTYRLMAHCLDEMKLYDLALAYYETGLAGRWDPRFGEFRKILGLDYTRFLRKVKKKKLVSIPEFASARLENMEKEFYTDKIDLLVAITWNTDGTDVDLHVVEPDGGQCYYKNKRTRAGGVITNDVTQGLGPEMYMIKKAVRGKYKIRVKYFASDQNRASTRTRVFVSIYQNWGTSKEKVIRKAVTLDTGKSMHDLATVKVKGFLW